MFGRPCKTCAAKDEFIEFLKMQAAYPTFRQDTGEKTLLPPPGLETIGSLWETDEEETLRLAHDKGDIDDDQYERAVAMVQAFNQN